MSISPYSAWPIDALCQVGECTAAAVSVELEPVTGKSLPVCHPHASEAARRRAGLQRGGIAA